MLIRAFRLRKFIESYPSANLIATTVAPLPHTTLKFSFFRGIHMADSKPETKNGSKKGAPSFVTPEYIELQRQKKAEKMAKKAALKQFMPQQDQPRAFNTDFIKRDMLTLPNFAPFDENKSPVNIKVMTYNVLAQTNIRRSMFPHSGEALKWKNRSKVLENEFKFYAPDIGCMQEVDAEFIPSFYKPLMESMGFDLVFQAAEGKTHGILIFWRNSLFKNLKIDVIHYDDHHELPGRMNTKNIGSCVTLERADNPSRGIFLATTHLFWHPYGSYERLRQGAILVKEVKAIAEAHQDWPVIIAGDFNTEPFDTNYPAMTTKPFSICQRATDIIERSMNYVFGESELEGKEEAEYQSPAKQSENDTESDVSTPTSITSASTPSKKRILHVQNEFVPHYSSFYEQHKQNPRLVSLYSYGYKHVDPENAKNTFEHPAFTNWANTYQGHLDYIFVMDRNSGTEKTVNEVVDGIKLKSLLRIPHSNEMKEAEPLEGRYPSDHVALMASIQLI
ncbi:CCR4/nocturin family endoribonuclease [Schizosaccharomyces cryophilus OY26]|uniref:CCR4/nocturin family endoribonuclease n=1 Tax=Schizosaccharomyces cryophilus (strain OY26 / ATCC MYA-4695 / CBS 11777 / NBRC 106824 / NRRL Y48691) TaxID=653667 RepID=S9W4S3_SCHCR|nr:CCR4/nocturin family endoribonuclease [Schizosaccharomyces cryophilus OY26]EPY52915.1 CCR4/nocturin family endoribonuclease [Schizosaccharomyces cryophilus OY26]